MIVHDVAVAVLALMLEAAFGYPSRLFAAVGHPVTWLGALLALLDRRLNREAWSPARRRAAGGLALAVLLAVGGGGALALQVAVSAWLPGPLAIPLLAALASSCLAQRSLAAHVSAVADGLRLGLPEGRRAVAMIVGRDVAALDEAGVARAAIESLAENFADGVVAPGVWLALLGLPGGVLYKAVNTADSMIGHRTPRHEAFGFAAAKVDDGANLLPARLAALWIVAAAALVPGASARAAWAVTRRDARGHASPNAGWPEAAMAGALGIRLGGPRAYAGRFVADRGMGDGARPVTAATIGEALHLYRLACLLNGAALAAVLLAALLASPLVIGRWR